MTSVVAYNLESYKEQEVMKITIRKLAEQAMRDTLGTNAKAARDTSRVFANLIIEAIQKGHEIAIPEIGKLVVKTYASRHMYCPVRESVVLYRKFKAVRFKKFTASQKHAEKYGV